ncbi:hypothetical protein [Shimia thalassica]|uniref:hypothetical protein n=1 Tax=Shimia thalassica TaxID=1715693 RepID=UPI0026E47D29|nr:hypothetical protein [Shimia thalassica]MDO6481906.1 hypothetical protein [Shimia thalassica]
MNKQTTPISVAQRLATVAQILELPEYSWASNSYIRSLIYNAEERFGSGGTRLPGNGFAPAVIRIGGKVLIDLDEFDAFVERHRMEPKRVEAETPCNTNDQAKGEKG